MGLFDDFKAFVAKSEDVPPVDHDSKYTEHRTQVAFDLSPAGQVLREVVSPAPAEKPIEKISQDEAKGVVHLEAQLGPRTDQKPNVPGGVRSKEEVDEILRQQDEKAVAQQETNRQGMLKESMDKSPAKPSIVDLEGLLKVLDYPASKVRDAIAAKVSEQTGAKVTGDTLTEYVGARTAPGDPVGQAVNSLITGVVTDPLTFLPGLGIPTTAYKAAGKAVVKGAETVGKTLTDLSKGVGVDLVAERGSISLDPIGILYDAKEFIFGDARVMAGISKVNPTLHSELSALSKKLQNADHQTIEQVAKTLSESDAKQIHELVTKAANASDDMDIRAGQHVYQGKIQQFSAELNSLNNKTLNNPDSLAGSIVRDVESSLSTLPRIMLESVASKATEQTGSTSLTAALMLTRAAVGGLAGGQVGNEEDAIRNAFIGAGLGAVASPKLIKDIANKVRGLHGVTAPTPVQQAAKEVQAAVPVKGAAQFREEYAKAIEKAKRLKPGEKSRHDVDVKAEAQADIEYARIDREAVANFYPGQTLNDNQKIAAAEVVTSSGKQLIDMAAMAVDDVSKDAVIAALFDHGTVLDAKFVGAVAESARSLRITGTEAPVDMQAKMEFIAKIRGIAEKAGPSANRDKVIEALKQVPTPEQLAIFSKNIVKPGLTDAWMSLWVNSILSGPQTHIANIMGNSATLTWGIAERQFAGLLGGDVHPGEAAAMIRGVFESFGDALVLGAKAFKTQESTFASAHKLESKAHIANEDLASMGVVGRSVDYLSNIMSYAAGRPLLAADEFFKAIAFRAEIRAGAAREFYADAANEGLTGKAARDRMTEIVNEHHVDVRSNVHTDAEQFAAYTTFTKELGPSGKWLQEGAAKIPAVKLVVPFIRTPINIFKFAGERTPFALFTKSMWTELQAGGVRQELALAKIGMGSMIAGTGVLWAANGFITGGGPNPKKFNTNVMKEGGWAPYSVNVSAIKRSATGGSSEWQAGDKMIAYNRIEPLGMLFGLYANYVEIVSNADQDSDYEELAMQLTMATVKTMTSKSFVLGMAKTALAFAFPEEFMGDTLTRLAVSQVPILGSSLSRGIARQIDPVLRDAEGFVEELMKNTPGLSSKLPPTLHLITGEPVYREGGVGPDIASPLYQSTYKKDVVIEEIVKNKVNVSEHPKTALGLPLRPDAAHELHKIITHDVTLGGRNLHDTLEHLFTTNVYKHGATGPDGRRAHLIKNIINNFRQRGMLLLLKQNPHLKTERMEYLKARAEKMKSVPDSLSNEDIDVTTPEIEVGGF